MCKMPPELKNLYIFFLYLTQKILKANKETWEMHLGFKEELKSYLVKVLW